MLHELDLIARNLLEFNSHSFFIDLTNFDLDLDGVFFYSILRARIFNSTRLGKDDFVFGIVNSVVHVRFFQDICNGLLDEVWRVQRKDSSRDHSAWNVLFELFLGLSFIKQLTLLLMNILDQKVSFSNISDSTNIHTSSSQFLISPVDSLLLLGILDQLLSLDHLSSDLLMAQGLSLKPRVVQDFLDGGSLSGLKLHKRVEEMHEVGRVVTWLLGL